MDFEAARKNADERLNQELLRIRNLPKKSKIKVIADKYGLKHASHTNAGLLKELEINLNVISREQRRVVNDLNKRQRVFTESQKKSLSRFLPPLTREQGEKGVNLLERREVDKKRTRKCTSLEQPPAWLQGRRESVNQIKRDMLVEMTAKSKQRTGRIIAENNKKTSIGPSLPPIHELELGNSWITRLNRNRVSSFGTSCFPSLLENKHVGEEKEKYLRTSRPIKQEKFTAVGDQSVVRERTFRGKVYEKVLKMPDPAKIPHLNPRDPKFYHVVMKVKRSRKKSKLEKSDAVIARTSTVFTKHWN